MFPISTLAIVAALFAAVLQIGAISGYLRRWRILCLSLPALALVISGVWNSKHPEYGGWPFFIALAAIAGLATLGIGQAWGWLIQRLGRSNQPRKWPALVFLCSPAVALTLFALERQYVPESCQRALAVDMNGNDFLVRIEDSALFRWPPGGSGEGFYRYSFERAAKDDAARLCRLSGGGSEKIAVDQIDFGQDTPMMTACPNGKCSDASWPTRFSLAAVSDNSAIKPSAWFGDQSRDDILWDGDNADGWICFLPSSSIMWLNCTVWITPQPGIRASASADRRPDVGTDSLVQELERDVERWLAHLRDFNLSEN